MADSYVFYPGDGVQLDWTVPFPYIDRSHVEVLVDGVATSFTWINPNTVRVSPAAANLSTILVRRTTPTAALTTFSDTNNLTADNLNLAETQALFVAIEAKDRADQSIAVDDATGQYDFGNRRATNVADPVNPQDAATKHWAETAMSSQLALATTAKTDAQTAQTAAAASAAAASTSASAAATSATGAAASKTAADAAAAATASDRTAVAADKVTVAADKATVAADKATVAADKATVAADKATVAADKATTSGYKTDAQTAATAAAAAQAAAELALDSFDDRYLGAKAADPALDNDGNALIEGALYWNTTTTKLRLRSAGAWVDAISTTGVTSFNGRTGAVAPAASDYSIGQISGAGALAAKNTAAEADITLADNTTNDASTTNHGFLKKLSNVAAQFMNGQGAWAAITDAILSLSDVTTNNVSITKHGFAPKAPNDATKYLDGTGAYSVPSGGMISSVTYTSSQTITIPTGATRAIVRDLLGGTGGGGGAKAGAGSNACGGSGGGAAALMKYLTGLTPGNTLALTIGAAGTAGSNTPTAGGNGGTSTLASGTQTITTLTAPGGLGGGAANGAGVLGTPGAGAAIATNGDTNTAGQSASVNPSDTANGPQGLSGLGLSLGGLGGKSTSNTGVAGAAGIAGACTIEWYP
jgi:hypothetical protein